MNKNHRILKKCLTLCLVLAVGTTAYLLFNLSGDKVDHIIQMSGTPAHAPADYNVVLKKPSYSWWSSNIVKEGVVVALADVAIAIVLRDIVGIKDNKLIAVSAVAVIFLFVLLLRREYAKFKDPHMAWFQSALKGDLHLIKSLLAQGKVDMDATDTHGNTALHLSALYGHLPCVKYLHQQGADIHARNNAGNTALLKSAEKGHLDCVKYLVEQGADTHARNNTGNTALLKSAENGHLACVKYLYRQGVDIDTTDNEGDTDLHSSAYKGHLPCVEYLVEQGPDTRYKNENSHKGLFSHLRWYKKPFPFANQRTDRKSLIPLLQLKNMPLSGNIKVKELYMRC